MLHSCRQGAWRGLAVAVLGLCLPLAVAYAEPPAAQALTPEAARKVVADLKDREIGSLTAEELAGLLEAKKVLAAAEDPKRTDARAVIESFKGRSADSLTEEDLAKLTEAKKVLAGGAAAVNRPSPEAEKEMAKLQGVWEVTSYQVGGKRDAEKEGLKWIIDRKWFVILHNVNGVNSADEIGSFTLDPAHEPKAIDFHEMIPKEIIQGIYQIDKDELKLQRGRSAGNDRPARFTDAADSEGESWVMRRLKDSGELALMRKTLKNEHIDDAPAVTEPSAANTSDPKEGDTVVIDTLTKRASVYKAPFANGLDDSPLGSIANGTQVRVLRTETNSSGKTWHFITWEPKDVEDGKVSIPASTTRGWVSGLTVRKPDPNK